MVDFGPGLVLVTGPNGVGKTNLLEALHVGSQGFSPRTRVDRRLVRFDSAAARVSLAGSEAGSPVETEVTVQSGEGKHVRLNGAALASAEALRNRVTTLVFLPDRLAVVKGGPLVRRAYLDRAVGRVFPARAALSSDYARALAQRNEALRHVRSGSSSPESVEPWTRQVAELGTSLDAARAELVEALVPWFRPRAGALGLVEATLSYEPRPLTVEALESRFGRDVAQGLTGVGPHLRDVSIAAGGRDLRAFGSQGEQRTAVLALVLAEAELARQRRGAPPLLLLDDVLSELDDRRRSALLEALPADGQTVITATTAAAVPAGGATPDLVLAVSAGAVRRA